MPRKSKTKEELQTILMNNFSNIELVSEYKTSKENVSFKCKDCGHEWKQRFFNLSGCPNCKTDKRYETLSHDDYISRLNQRGITLIIPVEKYVTARTNIKHKCLTCNYEWDVKPNNILTGYGCPFCSGQAVVKGINDLCTTDPDIANLLLNKDDGYKYSRMSSKKLNWVCQDCKDVLKQKTISNVVHQGLKCSKCSDGNSIPNKFITNILDSIKIDFETEKSFTWSENKRYDIYIPSFNCIIEMHGGQHYNRGFEYCGGRTLQEEIENDKIKCSLAKSNKIANYIIINCKSSNLDWIKNEILNSEICHLLDLDLVNWDECYRRSLHSNIVEASNLWNKGYSTPQIMKKLHVSGTTVCDYLRKASRIGLCTYLGFEERFKKVICLNTNEIFTSIKEAKQKYNACHIGDCCKGNRSYAGTHPVTKEKLVWKFVDDNLKGADCYTC